VNFILNIRR